MVRLTEQTEKLGITAIGTSERLRKILTQYTLPTDAQLNSGQIIDVITMILA